MDQDLSESARSALHELAHRVDKLEIVAGQLETAVYALQAAVSAKPSEPQRPAPAAPAVRPGGVCREEVFAVLFGCRDLTPLQQADALMKHRTIGPLLRGEHPACAAPAPVAPLDPPPAMAAPQLNPPPVLQPPAPAPAAEGEREELAALLIGDAECLEAGRPDLMSVTNRQLHRAAELLREPAPAPKRVVLPEDVPANVLERQQFLATLAADAYRDGCRDTWVFARAEVERQQGQQDGGQVDG